MDEKQLKALVRVLTSTIDDLEKEKHELERKIVKKDSKILTLLTNAQDYRLKINELERRIPKMSKVKYFKKTETKEFYYEDEVQEKILEKLGITVEGKGKFGALTLEQQAVIDNIVSDYLSDFETEWEEMEWEFWMMKIDLKS